MNVSKELIAAFFAHKCTSREAELVSRYLKENPGELEKYLSANEWENAELSSSLPEDFWNRQRSDIQKKIKSARLIKAIRKLSVAASVLFLIGAGIFYFNQKAIRGLPIAIVVSESKVIKNNSVSSKTVSLSDGTIILLQPNSQLSFKEQFDKTERNIVLVGEADFAVAKDKNRPFTVFSGNISTRALGTKFKVICWGNISKTEVHLYEGKVLVKSSISGNKKESYLLPGDKLTYAKNEIVIRKASNNNNKVFKEQKNDIQKNLKASINNLESRYPAASKRKGDAVIPQWYRFEKESLANVFDQLALLYHVKIEYDKEAVKNKSFIGRFEQTDSIDKVLKTISELNSLELKKVNECHFKIK